MKKYGRGASSPGAIAAAGVSASSGGDGFRMLSASPGGLHAFRAALTSSGGCVFRWEFYALPGCSTSADGLTVSGCSTSGGLHWSACAGQMVRRWYAGPSGPLLGLPGLLVGVVSLRDPLRLPWAVPGWILGGCWAPSAGKICQGVAASGLLLGVCTAAAAAAAAAAGLMFPGCCMWSDGFMLPGLSWLLPVR